MDRNVHQLVSVAKFTVIPGNEFDTVVIRENDSPIIKGVRVGITVKVSEGNLVLDCSPECP